MTATTAGCACKCICHLHAGRPIRCRNASRAGTPWCYTCAATTGCKRKA